LIAEALDRLRPFLRMPIVFGEQPVFILAVQSASDRDVTALDLGAIWSAGDEGADHPADGSACLVAGAASRGVGIFLLSSEW
jgi:hypothetical protein